MNETILADVGGRKVWLHGDRNGFLYSIGQLVAFDAATGQKKWVVKAPSPFMGGVLSTAGGLVFTGTP